MHEGKAVLMGLGAAPRDDSSFLACDRPCHRSWPNSATLQRFGLVLRLVSGKTALMEPIVTQTPASHDTSAPLQVVTKYIEVRPGYCGGEPHILGHRIKVRHVAVWHDQQGMTPTGIVVSYPTQRSPRSTRR